MRVSADSPVLTPVFIGICGCTAVNIVKSLGLSVAYTLEPRLPQYSKFIFYGFLRHNPLLSATGHGYIRFTVSSICGCRVHSVTPGFMLVPAVPFVDLQ